MKGRCARVLVALWLALGCTPKAAPDQGASPSASAAASPAPSTPQNAAPSAAPREAPPAVARGGPIEQAEVDKIVTEPGGKLVAQLRRTPPARAWLTLATRQAPLLPRARAAHSRIAELVSPDLVAPSWIRSVGSKELGRAADEATRSRLAKHARVLSDGTVEVAFSLAPADHLERVDLVTLAPEGRASGWETALSGREAPPENERMTLGLYQALLAVDYVAGNQTRRSVHFHAKSGRITAAEDNEAFSPHPVEGALQDGLARLSRHMFYSRALRDRLSRLERDDLDKALVWGTPATLLVTPKQVEEALDRARAVRRLIELRIKQRGENVALALP